MDKNTSSYLWSMTFPSYVENLKKEQRDLVYSFRGLRFPSEVHASEPKCPEHLHIIACRIVPNTLAVIQEADGWYQRAMAHLCPILESDLSLNPEPGAVFYYDSAANKVVRKKHEIKTRFRLKESSRAFELQHANKKN